MSHRRVKSEKRSYSPSRSIRQGDSCANKKRYSTEQEAELEAEALYINYYQCRYCKGYHLTSKEY